MARAILFDVLDRVFWLCIGVFRIKSFFDKKNHNLYLTRELLRDQNYGPSNRCFSDGTGRIGSAFIISMSETERHTEWHTTADSSSTGVPTSPKCVGWSVRTANARTSAHGVDGGRRTCTRRNGQAASAPSLARRRRRDQTYAMNGST